MPKTGMEPLRRRQVIDAVMECIHRDGIARASLKAIAGHAGLLPSHILHYFGDKEAIFDAVYRDLYARLSSDTRQRLAAATTPGARLRAVLEAQVSEAMLEPRVVSTWFALGAQATSTPRLARLDRINARRMTSNLVHDLRALGLTPDNARQDARELVALVYGLWTLRAHGTLASSAEARTILLRCLDARLAKRQTREARSAE